jgi:uncharacterized membrane protein YbaN (DUF454 family)
VTLPDLISAERRDYPPWKRALLLTAGWMFVVLGVVFWLLPIVTGVPFYVLGFTLLGAASPRVTRWINSLERRLPMRARLLLRRRRRS